MDRSPKLLNNEQAAERIGCTASTLRYWRHKGRGPLFIKFGASVQAGVAYDPADIDAWLAVRKFKSTSAVSVAVRNGALAQTEVLPTAPPSNVVAPPWVRSNG